MGDLQRKLFQNKLRQSEASLGLDFSEDETTVTDVQPLKKEVPEYSGKTNWKQYFQQNKIIERDGDAFNTYYIPPATESSPVFIFHHGAGSSGMTFAPLAKELISQMRESQDKESSKSVAGIFTFDARGHGLTKIAGDKDVDYSLDSFVSDATFIIKTLLTTEKLHKNPIFLIGHSLGGSIMTRVAYNLKDFKINGLGMFDIVEETAIRALGSMDIYLQHLPKTFKTEAEAISWHLKSNLVRNGSSANVSIPSYIKFDKDTGLYRWIIDLQKTKPFWDTWFTGLSKQFVNAPTSKLLILAGTDTLDKDLIIGQMQGKYQLVVFQDSGHYIQEDVPRKTALTLIDFWKRNDRSQVVIKSTWGTTKNS